MSRQRFTSASETLQIINKQWLERKDVEILANCGVCKAREHMQKITEKSIERGYRPLRGLVPTDLAVEYFKININYLKKIC